MESRIHSLFQISRTPAYLARLPSLRWIALCLVFAFGNSVMAQDDEALIEEPIIKPEEKRVDFDESKINVDDFEIGVYYGLLNIEDFGTDDVMGVKVAYHVTERFFVEGTYGLSKAGETSYEKLSGAAQLLTDEQRDYTYYNVSVGYNLFPGETYFSETRTYDSSLYVVLGSGNTEFAGDKFFTVSYGVGYRILFNDWVALNAMFKDHMFNIDLLGEDKTTHNMEMALGLSLFF